MAELDDATVRRSFETMLQHDGRVLHLVLLWSPEHILKRCDAYEESAPKRDNLTKCLILTRPIGRCLWLRMCLNNHLVVQAAR